MKTPRPRLPIRSQMMTATLAAGLLPLLLFVLSAQFITRRALMREQWQRIFALAEETGNHVGRIIANARADLRLLASNPVFSDPAPTEDRLREMKKIQQHYGLFADITLYDPSGGVVVSTTHSYWESVEHTVWFKQVLQEGRVIVSSPGRILGMEGIYLTLYAPTGEGTRPASQVITARLPFDRIADLVRDTPLGQKGFFVLLDTQGTVLHHPDASRLLTKFDATRPPGYWITHPAGVYQSSEGLLYAYAVNRLSPDKTGGTSAWFLMGLQPYAECLAPLQQQLAVLASIALLTLSAVYMISVFYSRRLSRPLIETAAAAQQVARGERHAALPEKGAWEIRQLVGAFNQMAQQVQQHRQDLERLVEQRTDRLRESQQKLAQITTHLRAAYETILDGVLMLEAPAGRVLSANQRFAEFFGLREADLQGMADHQLEGLLRAKLAHPSDDLFETGRFREHPQDMGVAEWQLAKPHTRTLSVYSAPVTGAEGRVTARLWVFRDLTRQRQLEEELVQAQKMEAIGRLAGGVAHDFNNLLTGIMGNLSLAEIDLPPASALRQYLVPARQAARQAAELINRLLGFSRRSRLQVRPCDGNVLAREVHGLLRHTVDPRIEIRLELQEDLWIVSADAAQLQQVLMNLCVNAAEAMPKGGRLTLHTRNVMVEREEARQWIDAREGDYVKICVQDEGQGMSLEVQQHLFEPFFTTKETGKGTGLGLAMSYGIVRQHGGWITCVSELNRGTTFCLYLPRQRAPAAGQAAEPAPAPLIRGGSERILLVDDEDAVRAIATAILRRYGYRVVQAANGREALEMIGREPPDLVILDLTMPGLSGQETFHEIRRRTPSLAIIISSGHLLDEKAFHGSDPRPPEGLVQKPYEAANLARAVRDVLDGRGRPA